MYCCSFLGNIYIDRYFVVVVVFIVFIWYYIKKETKRQKSRTIACLCEICVRTRFSTIICLVLSMFGRWHFWTNCNCRSNVCVLYIFLRNVNKLSPVSKGENVSFGKHFYIRSVFCVCVCGCKAFKRCQSIYSKNKLPIGTVVL